MSDARNRLEQAIAAQKGKPKPAAAAPPKPPPRQAPPAGVASHRSSAPAQSSKSAQKASRKKAPKKKAPKKKKPFGPREPGIFSRALSSFVEELKEATSEISPKAILDGVSDGLQSIRSLVSHDDDEAPEPGRPSVEAPTGSNGAGNGHSAETAASADSRRGAAGAESAADEDDGRAESSEDPATASVPGAAAGTSKSGPGSAPAGASASQAPGGAAAPPQFSPTRVKKVQAPRSKKKQTKPEVARPSSVAIDGDDAPLGHSSDSRAAADADDAPRSARTQNSPAEKPAAASAEREELPRPEDRARADEAREKRKSEEAGVRAAVEESPEEPEARAFEDPVQETVEEELPARAEAEQAPDFEPEAEPDSGQAPDADVLPAGGASENERPAAEAATASENGQKSDTEASEGASKPKKKPAPAPVVKLSKTEQLLRGLRALQIVLENPAWKNVATDLEARHTPLYAPRDRFDIHFADPVFRNGLKAAARLCQSFTFEPDHMRIDPEVVERVRAFVLDPKGVIKSDNDLLETVLGEEAVQAAMVFLNEKPVRELLYSVGTRLGTFVPTMEILARIYIGLRKKNDIIPGERLKIQEEVLVRYQKAPYTDAMGKKARNLALNYFMDYLTEYGMKLYKTRFNSVPEGGDTPDAHLRRHGAIRANCCHVAEEWGVRAGLSSHALFNVKARFTETADLFLKEQVGIDPTETEQAAT